MINRTRINLISFSVLLLCFAGISEARLSTKSYQDTNADKKPDLITETTAINSKNWTTKNNVLTGTITNISPLGRTSTIRYDTTSLLKKEITMTGLNPVIFNYDTKGRLIDITSGNRITTVAYDQNGNIDYLITPDSKTYDYTYDVMGRLKTELRPDGTIVAYDYDNNGNMMVLTNPKNIANTFDYTANDQRKIWLTPMSGSYLYSYDKERKLKTIQFPSGKLITNTYTKGLLTSTQTPEGITSYAYGCSSLLSGITKGSESIAYTYDGSLVTSVIQTGIINKTISLAYNNNFDVSSLSYAGNTYALTYDNDNLLAGLGNFIITRDSQNGLPKSISDTKLTVNRTVNGYGEIDSETSAVIGNAVYGYQITSRDNAGRITGKTETIGSASISWEYGYDQLGKLTAVKKDGQAVESYVYDSNGNRTSTTSILRGINSQTATYSTEDYTLTAGNNTYTFSVDGYLQSKATPSGINTYNYSSTGQLLSVNLENGKTIEYIHDSLGRRVAKKVDGQIVEKYLWLDLITLLAVYDANDNLIYRFNYASGRMPNSMEYNGQTYYLSYDQIGSLRTVTDTSGNIIKQINYDTFGNIITDTNPSFAVPFGFAGGLYDRDTGLVRFGLRDYDSAIGRWTAKDPIDFKGRDVNLLRYTFDDPINLTDPDGKIIGPILTITAAAVGIAVTAYAIWSWYKSPEYQNAVEKNEALGNKNLTDEEFIKAYDEYRESLEPALKKGKLTTELLNDTKPWEQTLGPNAKKSTPKKKCK